MAAIQNGRYPEWPLYTGVHVAECITAIVAGRHMEGRDVEEDEEVLSGDTRPAGLSAWPSGIRHGAR